MAIELEYPALNDDGSSDPRVTATVINWLLQGKANNREDIELNLDSDTTIIQDFRLGPESAIFLMPLDANAAGEQWWVSNQGDGVATVNHANNATVRAFRLTIVG